jgi:hypothetical protein
VAVATGAQDLDQVAGNAVPATRLRLIRPISPRTHSSLTTGDCWAVDDGKTDATREHGRPWGDRYFLSWSQTASMSLRYRSFTS